jgi:uncharacterized membrane protein YidH (DUF202 family)
VTNGQGGPPGGEWQGQRPSGAGAGVLAPHRGAAVLTLGILGLVVCFICGIIAWVMGNEDLRAMREGRMDRSGEGMTSAGRICGMISVILAVLGLVVAVIVLAAGGLTAWSVSH